MLRKESIEEKPQEKKGLQEFNQRQRSQKTVKETIYWTSDLKIISYKVCNIKVLQPNKVIPCRQSASYQTQQNYSPHTSITVLSQPTSPTCMHLDHRIWHYPSVITITPFIQYASFSEGDQKVCYQPRRIYKYESKVKNKDISMLLFISQTTFLLMFALYLHLL